MEPTFDKDNLPSDVSGWPTWRKTAITSAVKIQGGFSVQTSEGRLHCNDGYLAMDARGYPYPIASDEFHLIYEPLTEF